MLVLGGADHHAVGARNQIHRAAVHAGPDHPLRHRHTSGPPPQPQHLALHRPDRQIRQKRGRINPIGDHHGVHPRAGLVESRYRSGPLHSEPVAVRLECPDKPAIVDREFVGRLETVPDTLGQKRFEIPGCSGQLHRMPLCGQPLPDRPQVGGVGPIDCDDQ